MGLFLLNGCVLPKADTLYLRNAVIASDSIWQGRVEIDGSVEVQRPATLRILPGTEIVFVRRDTNGDWLGDSGLLIKGALLAEGTRRQPIVFRSAAANPQPGDWNEIRADFARKLVLNHVEIRDSVAGLHAHYTHGLLQNCWLHDNIDGSRFGEARFRIHNCLVERNQAKGILTRQSTLQLEKNIFRDNGAGLFFMEGDRGSQVTGNNFYANQYHLRLGDFSQAQIETEDNWLGSSEPQRWREKVYDRQQEKKLGQIRPHPAGSWRRGTGLVDGLALEQDWQFVSDGFIDASPLQLGDTLYAASWDGHLYALDRAGKLRWKTDLGAEIDAGPVAANGRLFVQNWQRQVMALDAANGSILWRFEYPESPADDHRQGALLPLGELVLLPAWGGTLYALEAATGVVRWQLDGYLPLRAAPVSDGQQIYLCSGNGSFAAISLRGELRWRVQLSAPLLSSAALTPAGPVVVARDGRVSAFTPDGRLRWQRELAETCYYSAPLYHQGMLYLATAAGSLRKLDAQSGETIWRLADLGAIYGSPTIAGRRLFVGNNAGQLYAINIDSAELLASFSAGRDIQSRPLLTGGQLVFGSRDAKLYALKLNEMAVQKGTE